MAQSREESITARRADIEESTLKRDERQAERDAVRAAGPASNELSEAIDRLRLKFSHPD